MAVFKCKMCGGTIEFENGATVGVCDSCGTKQTLPRLDDDRRANLYDRANHFRRNNDFDKAAGIYEQILTEDNTDAEAYWSLVLCRYGIEYVEDPKTHNRIPTVNRAQFTSIYMDEDYKSALACADAYQKQIYEEEAKSIDEIQKGILEISSKEEPFDVFICYKETDSSGKRTQDSVLATDLYHQLTQEGFKVFFAAITLEDKLGSAYEPYIFAALNSAKVMVVLGTKPEYFNAVWVKNEWSRYLSLIKNSGGKKMLIPAYKDMDPYDLPEEFSHLQAQDMAKLGFMQDLVRGIKKIIYSTPQNQTVKETVVVNNAATSSAAPLLERAFLFLEDGKWQDAKQYCEKALDLDPKNALAYLGKLMAELQVKNRKQLGDYPYQFTGNENYLKIMRFGDEKLKSELNGYVAQIDERNKNKIYDNAVKRMQTENSLFDYYDAIDMFSTIKGFKDADEKICVCEKKIKQLQTEGKKNRLERARKDEEVRITTEKDVRKRVKTKKTAKEAFITLIILAVLVFWRVQTKSIVPIIIACIILLLRARPLIVQSLKYKKAMRLHEKGRYIEAIDIYEQLNGYKDSTVKICECKTAIYNSQKSKLKNISVGKTIKFGLFKEDQQSKNAPVLKEIEWKVLAIEENKALIISEHTLGCKKYEEKHKSTGWNSCSLNNWLNNEFINKAFSIKHQEMIQPTTVLPTPNPTFYKANPGYKATYDIFLLSITEAEKYFNSNQDRKCFDVGGVSCWWLRSPGYDSSHAAYVKNDGSIDYSGSIIDFGYGVRPAMWISLN